MHLLHSIAIQPNLELKTQSKHILGSLPLDITLPASMRAVTPQEPMQAQPQCVFFDNGRKCKCSFGRILKVLGFGAVEKRMTNRFSSRIR
jgi:hypothetical protein